MRAANKLDDIELSNRAMYVAYGMRLAAAMNGMDTTYICKPEVEKYANRAMLNANGYQDMLSYWGELVTEYGIRFPGRQHMTTNWFYLLLEGKRYVN